MGLQPLNKYDKQSILSEELFGEIFEEDDILQRSYMIAELSIKAKELGVKSQFDMILKAHEKAIKEAEKKDKVKSILSPSSGSRTEFNIPIGARYDNMECGSWIATESGVFSLSVIGMEQRASHYPVLPVERLENVETGEEQIVLAFKRNHRWKEIKVQKDIVASANKIVSLARLGLSVTSESAKYLVRYLNDVEALNGDDIAIIRSSAKLGWHENDFLPYEGDIVFDGESRFKSLFDVLVIGDGAFKITFDKEISDYPIIEFYSGDKVEFNRNRGRSVETVFKTVYEYKSKEYILHEYYGNGYIKYKLMYGDKEVPLDGIPQTRNLTNVAFSGYEENEDGTVKTKGQYSLAVPVMFFKSNKWEGRGQSIFDKKIDAYDSLDEAWSQWMDALRAGRSKEYIPECLIPKNPNTGEIMKPNAFDNRFIATESDMHEGGKNEISLKQPAIPHESYMATYITALDLALQGIISPSTLGIDVKKLDNADAQREKEKATLYSRDAIVDALTEDIKALAVSSIMAYRELSNPGARSNTVEVEVSFAEYANPSFESQIETVGKGKQQGIMSIEACVEELYGDTKDDEWKEEEIARLKAEQGIATVEEPGVNQTAGSFNLNMKEGEPDAGEGSEQNVPDEPAGV